MNFSHFLPLYDTFKQKYLFVKKKNKICQLKDKSESI